MSTIIETCFPYKKVSMLTLKARRNPSCYQLIHPWPGRRPGILFRALILASLLSKEKEDKFWKLLLSTSKVNIGRGKVFMDPFMGSGTSLVESLSLGLRVIGVDVNTVAWFITKKTIEPVDINKLKRSVNQIINKVRPIINSLYVTRDPIDKRKVIARAYFWVKCIKCEKCKAEVRLFKNYKLARKNGKVWIYCPFCNSVSLVDDRNKLVCPVCGNELRPISVKQSYICPKCGHRGKILRSVALNGMPTMSIFAVMYNTNGYVKVKVADDFDFMVYHKAENMAERINDFLNNELRFGEETKRLIRYGYTHIKDLFNARQLLVIYTLRSMISSLDQDIKELLALSLSKTAIFFSILTSYTYKGNKPESMFMLHQYMHEKMYMEINPLEKIRGSFVTNASSLINAKEYTNKVLGTNIKVVHNFESFKNEADVLLLRASTLNLHEIPNDYVDLVVTDPPHFGNVIYSGIADFYYAIISSILKDKYPEFRDKNSCSEKDEIVYDVLRKKDEVFYERMLIRSLREVRRVLKPTGKLVLTFRHRDENVWELIYSSIKRAGFKIVREWPLECEGNIQPQARNVKARERAIVCIPYNS